MKSLYYHKGQPCRVRPILCEEGFCSECYVNLEYTQELKIPLARLAGKTEKKTSSKNLIKV
jgi:hypothetical protein